MVRKNGVSFLRVCEEIIDIIALLYWLLVAVDNCAMFFIVSKYFTSILLY